LSRSLRPWTSPVATLSLAKAAVSDDSGPGLQPSFLTAAYFHNGGSHFILRN
jgi:hypothetical protein